MVFKIKRFFFSFTKQTTSLNLSFEVFILNQPQEDAASNAKLFCQEFRTFSLTFHSVTRAAIWPFWNFWPKKTWFGPSNLIPWSPLLYYGCHLIFQLSCNQIWPFLKLFNKIVWPFWVLKQRLGLIYPYLSKTKNIFLKIVNLL
jgi:hypothetical protein